MKLKITLSFSLFHRLWMNPTAKKVGVEVWIMALLHRRDLSFKMRYNTPLYLS